MDDSLYVLYIHIVTIVDVVLADASPQDASRQATAVQTSRLRPLGYVHSLSSSSYSSSRSHNSPPASSFIFCPDISHVSIDTVHPSLLRSSSFSSPRWYHLQSPSSNVFLVSSLYVAKPPQSCFPAPLCDVLYRQSLPDVIVSHMVP